jgi:hypothetical protein
MFFMMAVRRVFIALTIYMLSITFTSNFDVSSESVSNKDQASTEVVFSD